MTLIPECLSPELVTPYTRVPAPLLCWASPLGLSAPFKGVTKGLLPGSHSEKLGPYIQIPVLKYARTVFH